MSKFTSITTPDVDGLKLEVGDGRLLLAGTITVRNPEQSLQPFMRQLHEAALQDGLKRVDVDVTALEFVNSSAIRMLIDWTTWVKQAAADGKGYKLAFAIDRATTWQRTSFVALQALASDVVQIN